METIYIHKIPYPQAAKKNGVEKSNGWSGKMINPQFKFLNLASQIATYQLFHKTKGYIEVFSYVYHMDSATRQLVGVMDTFNIVNSTKNTITVQSIDGQYKIITEMNASYTYNIDEFYNAYAKTRKRIVSRWCVKWRALKEVYSFSNSTTTTEALQLRLSTTTQQGANYYNVVCKGSWRTGAPRQITLDAFGMAGNSTSSDLEYDLPVCYSENDTVPFTTLSSNGVAPMTSYNIMTNSSELRMMYPSPFYPFSVGFSGPITVKAPFVQVFPTYLANGMFFAILSDGTIVFSAPTSAIDVSVSKDTVNNILTIKTKNREISFKGFYPGITIQTLNDRATKFNNHNVEVIMDGFASYMLKFR